ncbi:MAG TPA: ACT domain-containing protein [Verrucomicrobiae bacterium]|nr:ACT domain-containing protein [Verrucomicrobiae bacterium]
MTTRTELSIVLPNRPGTLGEVANALAKAKVNLLAIDASGGFEYNIVRIVPDRVAKARTVLRRRGLDVGETKVLCVPAADGPGALARVADALGSARVNIDYLYATAGGSGATATIVAHVSDARKAIRALR